MDGEIKAESSLVNQASKEEATLLDHVNNTILKGKKIRLLLDSIF